MGRKGQLRLKLLLNPGFQGARVSITDHFSVPFDPEAEIYNLYNLEIGANGALGGGKKIEEGRWHDLLFQWNCSRRECRVVIDRQLLSVLSQSRESPGACYLRLASSAEQTDSSGMLLESVEADVSTGWAEKAQATGVRQ